MRNQTFKVRVGDFIHPVFADLNTLSVSHYHFEFFFNNPLNENRLGQPYYHRNFHNVLNWHFNNTFNEHLNFCFQN